MAQRLTVDVGGVSLEGERRPGPGPVVVLLHAGVGDRRGWAGVADALGAPYDLVAYDRRGFGETPYAGAPFRHLDDLLAVLDAVSPGAPAWLVGSSMGGGLALDAALTAPDRVAGLVLIAPAVSGEPDPDAAALGQETQELVDRIEASEQADDFAEVNRLEVALWLDGPAGPEGRVGGAARGLALDMNRIALASGAPEDAGESGVDAWSRLGELRLPVTLAWGDLDLPVIVARCQRLAGSVPAVRGTHVFAGTAHLPYLERPGEVAEVIRAAIG